MKKSINVVILTHNNKELLKDCINSVRKSIDQSGLDGKITIVDNASKDGTGDCIRKYFPSTHYILNTKNLGTTKAWNVGIKSDINVFYTMLLNDDVELFPDTLASMVKTLSDYPDAKGIPACLVYPDGRTQRVKMKILGQGKKSNKNIQKVRFTGTTACLYRTEIFQKLEFFDEFYFFYNEDLDFSLKAKRNGMKFIFNADIKVIHHRKKGRKKAIKAVKPHYYSSNYYFYRKNFGILFSSVYLLMAFVYILLWRKRFRKKNEGERLKLLSEGIEKLRHTIKNYKKLRYKPGAV